MICSIESCLSKTPQARRITAPAPNPPYIAQGWRRYPKTGFHFAAINKFRFFSNILCVALFVFCFSAYSFANQIDEYQVKTAFVYNFLKFIEWENSTEETMSPYINIFSVGNGPFSKTLPMLQDRVANGKRIKVTSLSSISKLPKGCRVLVFVEFGKEQSGEWKSLLNGRSVLTIANEAWEPGFFIIHFFIEEKKVRFAINVKLARKAGIRVDSRLLKLAKIIDE